MSARATRASWSGNLMIAGIPLPVQLLAATEDFKSDSHRAHKECGTRIALKTWCPKCDRELRTDEIISVAEDADGRLTAYDKPQVETTNMVLLGVAAQKVDPRRLEKAYWFLPRPDKRDNAALGAYWGLQQALAEKRLVGLAEVTFRNRTRSLLIMPTTPLSAYELRPSERLKEPPQLERLEDERAVAVMAAVLEKLALPELAMPENDPNRERLALAVRNGSNGNGAPPVNAILEQLSQFAQAQS